jgi:hypothetical protein
MTDFKKMMDRHCKIQEELKEVVHWYNEALQFLLDKADIKLQEEFAEKFKPRMIELSNKLSSELST